MEKVSIIIGLSGSGKSTLANTLLNTIIPTPWRLEADWGAINLHNIDNEGNIEGSFKDDPRFEKTLNNISNGINIILDGAYFCNHKFLCEAEYYLKLNFPNIKITKYYFENNPKAASSNVLYREWVGGNYWTNETGELTFHGHHFVDEGENKGRRMYEVILGYINKFSKNYIIPDEYTPIKIQVQDERFNNGWRELIRK